MPAIKIQYDLGKADKPPPRQPVPPAVYDALIAATALGVTKQGGLSKFTVEYRILKKNDDGDATLAGRRVYQDYVFEPGPDPEMNGREAYRIRQLFDATGIAYVTGDGGGLDVNTDQLHNKAVKITVTQRAGKQPGQDGTIPVFNNVDRVDTSQKLDESNVI